MSSFHEVMQLLKPLDFLEYLDERFGYRLDKLGNQHNYRLTVWNEQGHSIVAIGSTLDELYTNILKETEWK